VKRIIAIDPGQTTGWASGVIEDKKLVDIKHGYDRWKDWALRFHDVMIHGEHFNIVVYESWLLRRSSALQLVGSDMQSSQCIGAFKMSCWLAQDSGLGVDIVTQHPKDKSEANIRMEVAGIQMPKSDVEHDRDALRHLYLYCFRKGIEVPQ
jgi:hypothetical protein